MNNSNPAKIHRGYIDSILATVGIDRQSVPTDILYDRAFSFASLQGFNQNKVVSKCLFKQATLELRNASYDTLQLPSNAVLKTIADQYYYRLKQVPLGILYSHFNYIDTLALDKSFFINDGHVYPTTDLKSYGILEAKILMAAILADGHEFESNISFVIPSELMLGNRKDQISNLKIDFGDGVGFRTITEGQICSVHYSEPGLKNITASVTTKKGETIVSTTNINIKSAVNDEFGRYGFVNSTLRQVSIYAEIPFTGNDGSHFSGLGWVTLLIRDTLQGLLKKPVLIVDGFDPGNIRNDKKLFDDYLNSDVKFADSLYEAGYDIVILDLPKTYNDSAGKIVDGGGDYIQRNAMVVVKLIQEINMQLLANESDEQLVVIGPSMGGLITRYALSYMEQQSLNHNTRLWISFDSPHNGANISIGVQHFINFFKSISAGAEEAFEKLDCIAARQQLVHHFRSNSEFPLGAPSHRNSFVNDLDLIGFPQNLRKVSVINGSINSTKINNPCTRATKMSIQGNFLWGWSEIGWGYINTTPSYGNRCLVFKGKLPGSISTNSNYVYGLSSSFSLDNSPGGTTNTFEELSEDMYGFYYSNWGDGILGYRVVWDNPLKIHSFVPTKSGLAFTGSNPDLAENISSRNLVFTQETPFDSYWGPVNKNMGHIEFDSDMVCWLMQELSGNHMNPSVISQLSGSNIVCHSNSTFTLQNLPPGFTVTWSHTPGLLTYVSGQGTDSYTVQAASSFASGSGNVSAVITGPCGPSQPITKTVWVGKPNTPFAISGFLYNGALFGSDTEYEFRALTGPGMVIDYYNWVIGCGSIVFGHGTDDIIVRTCTAPDYVTMNFDVSIRVGNECGQSDWLWRTGYVVGESGATYMVYPNPASSEITVALNEKYAEANPEKAHEFSINQVRIMDHMGKSLMLKNFYAQELSVRINISSLPKGYYIVKINEGESHTILKD